MQDFWTINNSRGDTTKNPILKPLPSSQSTHPWLRPLHHHVARRPWNMDMSEHNTSEKWCQTFPVIYEPYESDIQVILEGIFILKSFFCQVHLFESSVKSRPQRSRDPPGKASQNAWPRWHGAACQPCWTNQTKGGHFSWKKFNVVWCLYVEPCQNTRGSNQCIMKVHKIPFIKNE